MLHESNNDHRLQTRRPPRIRPRFRPWALLFLSAATALSAELNVPRDYRTIQAAITAGAAGDLVKVEPGTYRENLDYQWKALTVASTGGPEKTILDAGQGLSATIGGAGALIGFTLTQPIILQGPGALIKSNIFRGGVDGTPFGAAIQGNAASPVIDGNIFRNYFVTDNYEYSSGTLVFYNSSSPVIINNLFESNACRAINLNLPLYHHPRPLVANNTFVGNKVALWYSANYTEQPDTYRNNIFYGNGIGVDVSALSSPTAAIWEDNLVFGNGIDFRGMPAPTGQNGNLAADPLFLHPAGHDYRLLAASPAIDAGTAESAPDYDLSGQARPIEGDSMPPARVDIGAYEYAPGPPRPSTFLSARSVPEGAIVSWTAFDGSTLYQLLRSTNLAGPYETAATLNSTNYFDTNAFLGVTNFYFIAGSNHFGMGPRSTPIAIRAGNRPPVAISDSTELDEDADVRLNPLLNDLDPDEETLRFEIKNLPSHGTAKLEGDKILYTPFPNFWGTDSFTYRVLDAYDESSTGEVRVTVKAVDDPPTVALQSFNATPDAVTTLFLRGQDIDSTDLLFTISLPPEHGIATFNPQTGEVQYSPAHGFEGVDTFRYQAFDGNTFSSEAIIFLNVLPAPDLDRDGMPDWWETIYDLNNPAGDRDRDGSSNLAEYQAGTSPVEPGSVVRFIAIFSDGPGTRLIWQSTGGVRYRLQAAEHLSDGTLAFEDLPRPISEEIDPAPYNDPGTQSFIDTRPPSLTGKRFYRVKVIQ